MKLHADAGGIALVLLAVGGVLYTVGAVVYARRQPDPVPSIFGYHELFHALTVLAYLCHWTGILVLALNPPTF